MLDKFNTSFNYVHVISLLEANTPAHGGEEHEFSTYVERRSTSQKKKASVISVQQNSIIPRCYCFSIITSRC